MKTIEVVVTKVVRDITLRQALAPFADAPAVAVWLKYSKTLNNLSEIEDVLRGAGDPHTVMFECGYSNPRGFCLVTRAAWGGKCAMAFRADDDDCIQLMAVTVGCVEYTTHHQIELGEDGTVRGYRRVVVEGVYTPVDVARAVHELDLTEHLRGVLEKVVTYDSSTPVVEIAGIAQSVGGDILAGWLAWNSPLSGRVFAIRDGGFISITDGVVEKEDAYPHGGGVDFDNWHEIPESLRKAGCDVSDDFFWEICPERETLESALAWVKEQCITPPSFRPSYMDE